MIPGFVCCLSFTKFCVSKKMTSKPSGDILAHIKKLLNATGSVLDFIKTLLCKILIARVYHDLAECT